MKQCWIVLFSLLCLFPLSVYAEENTQSYKVKYYHDLIAEDNLIFEEIKTGKVGKPITDDDISFETHRPEGYFAYPERNLPLTLQHKETIVNVVYKRLAYSYQIYYYYDSVLDEQATETMTSLYGAQISSFHPKEKNGYRLQYSSIDDIPLIVTEELEENKIMIFYERDMDALVLPPKTGNHHKKSLLPLLFTLCLIFLCKKEIDEHS